MVTGMHTLLWSTEKGLLTPDWGGMGGIRKSSLEQMRYKLFERPGISGVGEGKGVLQGEGTAWTKAERNESMPCSGKW